MPVNMRADNNWEDAVGKRLYDFEGELSPQAWQKINQRIQPKPKPWYRWLWLPALLLFISLPIAFYLKSKTAENQLAGSKNAQLPLESHEIAKTEKPRVSGKDQTQPVTGQAISENTSTQTP